MISRKQPMRQDGGRTSNGSLPFGLWSPTAGGRRTPPKNAVSLTERASEPDPVSVSERCLPPSAYLRKSFARQRRCTRHTPTREWEISLAIVRRHKRRSRLSHARTCCSLRGRPTSRQSCSPSPLRPRRSHNSTAAAHAKLAATPTPLASCCRLIDSPVDHEVVVASPSPATLTRARRVAAKRRR